MSVRRLGFLVLYLFPNHLAWNSERHIHDLLETFHIREQ